ncbi:MAG: hypothetical protein RMK84_00175 [Oscillochloridaceae bacterium]|nr:hypothetical protein [Chloroflexaceae bacterium]MDW8388512.1 hypothetical protein [Oscillochloridaceae bacterium]
MEALQSEHRPVQAPLVASVASPQPFGAPDVPATPTTAGSMALDPATIAPTPTMPAVSVLPLATSAAAEAPPLLIAPAPERSNEQRWREQQLDRQVFPAPRLYTTRNAELCWYDPLNQQHVVLGRIGGDFLVQATFVLRDRGLPALEVPYRINVSYGLTALSPAYIERLKAAGYVDWVETYVLASPDVHPR